MPLGRYSAHRAERAALNGVAESRVRFLTDEPVEPGGVRDAILASWWRSRRFDVAADRIQLPYVRDPDLDTRCAGRPRRSHYYRGRMPGVFEDLPSLSALCEVLTHGAYLPTLPLPDTVGARHTCGRHG